MAENTTVWYVRNRGRVLGPFAWSQLEAMRDRGQLARFHEVSRDRRSWTSAASLAGLFPGGEKQTANEYAGAYEVTETFPPTQDPRFVSGDGQSGPSNSSDWFYSRGGVPGGPVSYSEIRRLASLGQLTPEALIWCDGMSNWAPCRQFPDLFAKSPGHPSPAQGPPPGQASQRGGIPPLIYGPPRTSGLAVASLVLGILWLCGIGSLLATILGAVALSQISRSNGALTGKGMAVAGLVLGIVGLLPFAFAILVSLSDPTANPHHHRF